MVYTTQPYSKKKESLGDGPRGQEWCAPGKVDSPWVGSSPQRGAPECCAGSTPTCTPAPGPTTGTSQGYHRHTAAIPEAQCRGITAPRRCNCGVAPGCCAPHMFTFRGTEPTVGTPHGYLMHTEGRLQRKSRQRFSFPWGLSRKKMGKKRQVEAKRRSRMTRARLIQRWRSRWGEPHLTKIKT